MYFYACPYCDPCDAAKLIAVKAKNISCKYDNEDVCEEKHKCKEVMHRKHAQKIVSGILRYNAACA